MMEVCICGNCRMEIEEYDDFHCIVCGATVCGCCMSNDDDKEICNDCYDDQEGE